MREHKLFSPLFFGVIAFCIAAGDGRKAHNGKIYSQSVKVKTSPRNNETSNTATLKTKSLKTGNVYKIPHKNQKLKQHTKDKVSSEAGALLLNLATGVVGATKKSIKSGYDLLSYKHVALVDIVGKWKFTQEVTLKKNIQYSCPATALLLKNGTVITTCNGKEYRTKFEFKERKWPRYCTIKFHAYAFQGPSDPEPVNMLYKGHFKRSYFNKKAILMRGKIYRTSGKLWKKTEKCGKFKGTLRT